MLAAAKNSFRPLTGILFLYLIQMRIDELEENEPVSVPLRGFYFYTYTAIRNSRRPAKSFRPLTGILFLYP